MGRALLPDEFIGRQFRDVTVSAPIFQKPLPGQLQLTNLRLIWAGAAGNFLTPYIDVSDLELVENSALRLTTSAPDGRGRCVFQLRPFAVSAQELFTAVRDCLERAREHPNFGVEVVGTNSTPQGAGELQSANFETSNNSNQRGVEPRLDPLDVAWTPGLEAALERLASGRSGEPTKIEYDAELGVAFETEEGFDRRMFE